MQTPQTPQFFELYRAGMRTMAEVMQTSLEGAERLQRQQLDLLHSAVEDNVKSAREIAEAKSLDEMLSLQTRYGRSQLERTVDFWNRMWRTAGENQMSLIGQAQSQLGAAREGIREMSAQQQQQQQQSKHERKSA
ncbi:MAG: Phasin protein [Burkholderiales bacterium]|jgi:phasin family protein|nr:Phasin protein [Burkholderiales bacterium]